MELDADFFEAFVGEDAEQAALGVEALACAVAAEDQGEGVAGAGDDGLSRVAVDDAVAGGGEADLAGLLGGEVVVELGERFAGGEDAGAAGVRVGGGCATGATV